MKKATGKERFRYWLDNTMARGAGAMIRLLALFTALVIVLVAAAVTLCGAQEDGGFGSALWDSFASTVNAWVLYAGDGSAGYILLMAAAAIAGLFITSLLISILSTGIEERLSYLRRGSSRVLESGHTVVLGFDPGAYKLLRELCDADGAPRRCIVVAGAMEKEAMEELIRENVRTPKGLRIICRSVDVCDPAALACCAIPECRTVIISAAQDGDALRCVLAVSELLRARPDAQARIVVSVRGEELVLPAQIAGEGRAIVLHVGDVVARLIARTCTQPGLSEAFTELFSYSGADLHLLPLPALGGLSFADASLSLETSTLLGFVRDGRVVLNPGPEAVLEPADRLLLLASPAGPCAPLKTPVRAQAPSIPDHGPLHVDRVLILGGCGVLDAVRAELDGENCAVTVAETESGEELEALAAQADHIILLSDTELDAEAADVQTLRKLLLLRDIRDRRALPCSITTEMRLERTKRLARNGERGDFIVAADVAAMLAAQLAVTPELEPVFEELLGREGSELYLLPTAWLAPEGTPVSNAALRAGALRRGWVYLGHMRSEAAFCLNPPLSESVTLTKADSVLVLAQSVG